MKLLQRVRRALATVVHAELTSLKQRYKNEGFSQAAHRAVIPDRPAITETSNAAPGVPSAPAEAGVGDAKVMARERRSAVFSVYTRVGNGNRARAATDGCVGRRSQVGIGRLHGCKRTMPGGLARLRSCHAA